MFDHIRSLKNAFLLSLILIIGAISITLFYTFGIVRKTALQEQDNFQQLVISSQLRLEQMLSSSYNAAQIAAYSGSCQKFLLSNDASTVIYAKQDSSTIMNYLITFGEDFRDVVLLSSGGRKLSITNSYIEEVTQAINLSGINYETDSHPVYTLVQNRSGEKFMIHTFPVYGNIDGYRYRNNPILCSIVYDMESITNCLRLPSYKGSIAALYDQGQLLCSTQELTSKMNDTLLSSAQNENGEILIGANRYLISTSSVKGTAWTLIYLLPIQAIALQWTQNLPFFLLIGSVLLVTLLLITILIGIRRDIDRLTSNIRLAETSTDSIALPHIQELHIIASTLNTTLNRLQEAGKREQELIAANYEAMLAQTKAEILGYRSQINPHFLFNSLESARSLAHYLGATPIEKLIGNMARLFRYPLYSPMIVPLRTELEHLDNYLSVMEIRFPRRYRVLHDYAHDTLDQEVLSMLLQPLVENVLQHAFRGLSSGTLLIQSFNEEDMLIIKIADNGIGMDEDELNSIQWRVRHSSGETATLAMPDLADTDPLDHSQETSIGLSNIYRRIRLTFGEHADLIIKSRKNYYTVVELRIPTDQRIK